MMLIFLPSLPVQPNTATDVVEFLHREEGAEGFERTAEEKPGTPHRAAALVYFDFA